VCLFLSVFALDAFTPGRPFGQALPDYLIHVAPAILLLVVVALAWKREWIGGLVFTSLAVGYVWSARHRADWVLTNSGPLLAVGGPFWWSWIHRRSRRQAHA
jgi:hypothetical protein